MDAIGLGVQLLIQVAVRLPLLIIFLGGGILILMRMQTNSVAASLALGGIALALIELLASAAVNIFLPLTLMRTGTSAADMGFILSGVNIATGLLSALAWGLMIVAVYISLGRSDRSNDE